MSRMIDFIVIPPMMIWGAIESFRWCRWIAQGPITEKQRPGKRITLE